MNQVKTMVWCGLLLAMSFLGANIKVFGTIAFDSMPAFLGTLVLGFGGGGLIGFLGHFLTAMMSGFQFGIWVHLIIAGCMVLTMAVFRWTHQWLMKRNIHWGVAMVCSCLMASLVNGPVSLLLLVPFLGTATCIMLLPPLFTASFVNAFVGYALYYVLVKAKVISRQARRSI